MAPKRIFNNLNSNDNVHTSTTLSQSSSSLVFTPVIFFSFPFSTNAEALGEAKFFQQLNGLLPADGISIDDLRAGTVALNLRCHWTVEAKIMDFGFQVVKNKASSDLLRRGIGDVDLDDAEPEQQLLGLHAGDLLQLPLLDERRDLAGVGDGLLDLLEAKLLDVLQWQEALGEAELLQQLDGLLPADAVSTDDLRASTVALNLGHPDKDAKRRMSLVENRRLIQHLFVA
uniref:Uncharacterized protein n=1 Tax=Oryza barthii TaxID=65489 RepID=A0A0D3GLP5_9ORYZ